MKTKPCKHPKSERYVEVNVFIYKLLYSHSWNSKMCV